MKVKKHGKKITIKFEDSGEASRVLRDLGFTAIPELLDRAAELPLEPSAQHSEAGDAPTLSGLYNCQLCGLEKCSQPGICKDCLSEPSKAETNQWSAANTASS